MEKLKGLKLSTGDKELAPTPALESGPGWHNPLSPEGSDVAISGFSSFAALKGEPDLAVLAAKPPQPPAQQRKVVAQRPPDSFQQRQSGMGSLNAFAAPSFSSPPAVGDDKDEDDLFALPMSPRSPEMTKSPFTFAAQDTG